jgi:glutathione S-transferase
VPVLVDGPLVLLESGAIVQYLLETYGHGRLEPDRGSPERAKFLQWIHFAEATLTPPLAALLRHERGRQPEEPGAAGGHEAARRAKAALAVVEDALQDREWLTGEFSAADVMMGYGLALAKRLRLTDELPNIKAYVARCEARPAFRRACKT